MNEEQWLSSTDPSAMLFALRPTRSGDASPIQAEGGNPGHSDRQLRLFCCACCRLNDAPNRHVEECEREGMLGLPDTAWANGWARVDTQNVSQTVKAAILRDIIGNPFRPVVMPPAEYLRFDGVEVRSTPILSRGAWQTPTVVAIARSIYDDRRFEDMPILADALMDTGCHDKAVLNHCSGEGLHVRGCWLLDLILGKE